MVDSKPPGAVDGDGDKASASQQTGNVAPGASRIETYIAAPVVSYRGE